MGEFIFGRGRSKTAHSYPDPRQGAPGTGPFARNFATGPGGDGPITVSTSGTQIPWGSVDVAGSSIQDVPITPKSSGVIRISGEVVFNNTTDAPLNVQVQVQIDNVTYLFPADETNTVDAAPAPEDAGREAVPFLVQVPGLAIGTTVTVQVLVTSLTSEVTMPLNSSSVEVQEVAVSSG